MAVINNPDLREVARQIVCDPEFSRTNNYRLRRALQRFGELTTAEQRTAVAETLIVQWLLDEHAEYLHEGDRRPGALPAGDAPKVVTAQVEGEPAAPVSELKFRSESPDWQPPGSPVITDSLGGQRMGDAQSTTAAEGTTSLQAKRNATPNASPPAGSRASRSQPSRDVQSHPAAADNLPGGQRSNAIHGEVAAEEPSSLLPVQQPSRKIAAYQQMFPELHYPVQTPAGPKPLAEFTVHDIGFRIGELRRERQAWAGANLGDKARIEDRDRLNAQDRVRIAERLQNIRDAEAEEKRLALAERELDGYDVAVIGELPPEALDACGFRRRVA